MPEPYESLPLNENIHSQFLRLDWGREKRSVNIVYMKELYAHTHLDTNVCVFVFVCVHVCVRVFVNRKQRAAL